MTQGVTPPPGTVQTVREVPTVPRPNDSGGSNTPNGSRETPQPSRGACEVCGQPLHPAIAAEGFTTCPACEATQ